MERLAASKEPSARARASSCSRACIALKRGAGGKEGVGSVVAVAAAADDEEEEEEEEEEEGGGRRRRHHHRPRQARARLRCPARRSIAASLFMIGAAATTLVFPAAEDELSLPLPLRTLRRRKRRPPRRPGDFHIVGSLVHPDEVKLAPSSAGQLSLLPSWGASALRHDLLCATQSLFIPPRPLENNGPITHSSALKRKDLQSRGSPKERDFFGMCAATALCAVQLVHRTGGRCLRFLLFSSPRPPLRRGARTLCKTREFQRCAAPGRHALSHALPRTREWGDVAGYIL